MNVKNNLSLSVEGKQSPDPNEVTIFMTQYWPRLYYSYTGLELRLNRVAQVWTSFASIVVTKNRNKQVTQWVKKITAITALKAIRTKFLFFKKISSFFLSCSLCTYIKNLHLTLRQKRLDTRTNAIRISGILLNLIKVFHQQNMNHEFMSWSERNVYFAKRNFVFGKVNNHQQVVNKFNINKSKWSCQIYNQLSRVFWHKQVTGNLLLFVL